MAANPEVEAYIRSRAPAYGIDPDTAVAVSKSEALNVFDPTKPDRGGDEGSSFGPFQLHYAGYSKNMPNPGLGDAFTKATGLHASDPSTWKQQIDFALATAAKDGWRQWMGAANTGIGRWAGIAGNAGAKADDAAKTAYASLKPGDYPPRSLGGAGSPNVPETAGGAAAPVTSPGSGPYDLPVPVVAKTDPREKFAELASKAVAGFGGTTQPFSANLPPQPAAANVQAEARPMFDPQQQEQRRQQLALLMQRLNQGTLV